MTVGIHFGINDVFDHRYSVTRRSLSKSCIKVVLVSFQCWHFRVHLSFFPSSLKARVLELLESAQKFFFAYVRFRCISLDHIVDVLVLDNDLLATQLLREASTWGTLICTLWCNENFRKWAHGQKRLDFYCYGTGINQGLKSLWLQELLIGSPWISFTY